MTSIVHVDFDFLSNPRFFIQQIRSPCLYSCPFRPSVPELLHLCGFQSEAEVNHSYEDRTTFRVWIAGAPAVQPHSAVPRLPEPRQVEVFPFELGKRRVGSQDFSKLLQNISKTQVHQFDEVSLPLRAEQHGGAAVPGRPGPPYDLLQHDPAERPQPELEPEAGRRFHFAIFILQTKSGKF